MTQDCEHFQQTQMYKAHSTAQKSMPLGYPSLSLLSAFTMFYFISNYTMWNQTALGGAVHSPLRLSYLQISIITMQSLFNYGL